jgi:hypothetical protein
MRINQHPHHAQAVFATVSSAPPAAAKQHDESATASTRAEEERDTVELTRPNVQAIAQLLNSDRNLQLPPLPAASSPSAHNAGPATNPDAEPAPPSAPILGDTQVAPSIPGDTGPTTTPATPSATSPIATTGAEATGVGKGEGTGALSGGTEDLSDDDQREVQELKNRDREVRAHEQAHIAAAGAHSRGGPSYEYQRGPDNRQYAVGGEVQIDTSAVSGDPEATIRKAQTVRRAANAPAEPSSQDRSVASAAAQMEAKARRELTQQQLQEMKGGGGEEGSGNVRAANDAGAAHKTSAVEQASASEEMSVADTGDSTASEIAANGPDLSATGATGKFVNQTSGDAGALFDLIA